ncbi:UNVERIFIED_CONTAM: hypothetical protein FKN15_049564 [Acipenser sinensis]
MAGPEVVFSGKHNGICIYFTRILGNIWDGSIGIEKTFNTGNQVVTTIESSVSSKVLESVLHELNGLKEFLDKNSQFTPGSLGSTSFSTPANLQQRLLGFMRPDGGSSQQVQQDLQRKYHTEAQAYEKISLQGIQQLVHRTCQTLALWKLICDHQFSVIIADLQKVSFYSRFVLHVHRENKAGKTEVRFYEGVVELCLTAADKKDPQRLGPHFYKNGEPEEDTVGQQAFQDRLNCYKCITDTIQELVNQSKAAPQSPSVPKQPGPPVMSSDPNMLSNEDATAHFEQMLGLAQRSNDELFHIALYNWLIQADLTDKLLEVNSPYLEDHLMRMIKQDQNKVCYMDLLWRYYEKNKSFNKASHVLARLADMHDPCWQRLKKALHLLDCIYILLSGYVEDPNKVPASDRLNYRKFTDMWTVAVWHFVNASLPPTWGRITWNEKLVPDSSHIISSLYSGIGSVDECHVPETWLIKDVHSETACAVIQSMARFMAAYFTNQPLYVLPPHNVDILPPLQSKPVDECHVPETWLIKDVHSETACAVIQSMARFMAAYFTNQPLYVLPPHNVDILPPLQSKPDALPRVIPLQHSLIASIVRDQHLSAVWTVEYALDLLLIGGLVPEAAWLAHRLGDWKMAVSLSLAYNLYCQSNLNLSGTIGLSKFSCFCQAGAVDLALRAELVSRQRVSGVLQRVLLLFRAARCSLPSAQWYIQKLKHSRKIMNKIRLKGSQPQLNSFPDSLLKYTSRRGFFKPGPSGDQQSDPVSIRAISTFRELCSLCWMFHVRERLSASCRKYQLARNSARDPEGYVGAVEYDAGVAEHCLDALEWACRLLPFARFMNAEEITQDVILSLVGELPPIRKAGAVDLALRAELVSRQRVSGVLQRVLLLFRAARCSLPSAQWYIQKLKHSRKIMNKVAEVLVKVFPEQEDSVRVPLREKYNCLLQRLRHSTVKGPEREEMMSVVIQDLLKQRCKQLKRIARNIGPVEFHIWEKAEEGVAENDNPLCDRFSLGTSLSQSTLTDFGRPQVYSDDTADTISEQLQGEDSRDEVEINQSRHSKPQSMELMPDKKKVSDKPNRKLKLNAEKVEGHVLDPLALPVVGSWEFECDDDEYVRFLELFLSYMLEKGLVNNQDSGIPFLACFSSHLREHELNSLLFDVHTTLKRRQNQKGSSNIFRAGSCYHLVPGPPPAPLGKPVSVHSETWSAQSSLRPSSSMADPSETNLNANQYFPGAHKGKQKGLFGLRRQPSSPPRQDGSPESMPTPRSVSLYSQSTCDPLCSTPRMPQTEAYIYKALLPKEVDPPVDELTPELQSRFRLTGRLLEWMIRWSDRRLLCGPSKAQRLLEYSTVIRVKASAPAILSSLWMLERRYSAGLLVDKHLHSRVPEREYIVAPVFQQEHRSKVERESSVDTGYPASAETPITLLDQEIFESQHGHDSETASDVDEGHKSRTKDLSPSLNYDLEEVTSDLENKDEEDGMALEEELDLPSVEEGRLCFFKKQSEMATCAEHASVKGAVMKASDVDEGHKSRTKDLSPSLNYDLEEVTSDLENKDEEDGMALEEELDLPSVEEDPTSGLSATTVPIETGEPQRRDANTQPPANSEAVRQMLQDEMFRLVQSQRLTLLDLECPRTFPAREQELEQMVALPQAEGTNAKSSLPNSVSADMAAAETSSPVTGGDPCPAFCVQFHTPDPTSGLSATTVPIETGEPQRRDANTQPLANSEAVRQMLQDEMFRLVQLQQINFMSLMQVVGSSFMNLPNVQQNLQEAQSNQMNGNQPLNRINERPRQSTGVQHREPVLCNQQQSSLEKHTGSSKNLNADDQSNKENIAQNPPPLILHLDPPQSQPESEGLIPASHGLLTTSPNKRRVQLLVPPSDTQQTPTLIPLEKTSGRAKGLQLLKLQPPDQFKLAAPSVKPFIPLPRGSAQFLPQPREAWAPSSLSSQPENNPRIHPHWKHSGPPSHLNLSQYDPEALRRAEEEKARWAEKVAKGPPRHLNLEQYEGNPVPEAQHWVPSGSPERRGTGAQPLVPLPPRHTFPCLGLPLLRLQPAVYQLSSACMIPPLQTASQTAPGRPLPTGCAAPVHCPSLQMLQANHPPISKALIAGPIPTSAELHCLASTKKKPADIQDASTNTEPASLPVLFSFPNAFLGAALYLSHAARLEDLMEDDEEDLLSETVPPSAAASPPVLLGRSLLFAPSTASSIAGLNASSADFDIMPREAHVLTEDVLDLTGLSDIADILGDLVKDGGISATDLGLSEMQARRLPSTGKARGRGPGQAPTRTEKERREIREWMKRKQQQRLAEYRKQKEHSPFKAGTATINLTSKDIKVNNKIKEEKKKMVLSEHNSQRAMEALNLMNEMLSDTVPLPTTELSPLADTPLKSVRSQGQRSARGGRPVSRSQSAGHTARSPSNVGQTRSLSYSPCRPSQYTGSVRTGALQKKPSAATGRASSARSSLGLHRPASALPRDRMSQITRRGMLTDLSSWKSKSQTSEKDRQDPRRNGSASHSQASALPRDRMSQITRRGMLTDLSSWKSKSQTSEKDRQDPRRTGSASHSQGSRMLSSAGPGRPSPYPRARSTRVESEAWPERDVVSPWSPPAEIRRLLEMDVSVQDPLLDEDGSLLRRGVLDGLDCLSESTGSILSKLDWAAIENMLASEEDL